MKNIISFLSLIIVSLLITSSVLSQEIKTPVEEVNSDIFSVKKVNLIEQDDAFQLQFSILNKSKITSPGLQVILSGYDKSGNLQARQIQRRFYVINLNSRVTSLLDVNSLLKGAFRYTAEFSIPEQTENFGACTDCTNDAIRACAPGGVASTDCSLSADGTYSCSYVCKGKVGGIGSGS